MVIKIIYPKRVSQATEKHLTKGNKLPSKHITVLAELKKVFKSHCAND